MTRSTTFSLGLASLVCALGAAQAATAKVGAPVAGHHSSHAAIHAVVMDEPRTEAPFNVRLLSPVDADALARFLARR